MFLHHEFQDADKSLPQRKPVMSLKLLKNMIGVGLLTLVLSLRAGPLETYVAHEDASYRWVLMESGASEGYSINRLQLESQTWREHLWTHRLLLVRPKKVRNADVAFLYITGDGRGHEHAAMLKRLAERAGAVTAVVTDIPNQPLYEGRYEDALIAYTLERYLQTGDTSWPLLFPMVKSAVRAMDAVQEFSRQRYRQNITRFVVAGTSKRGWTTWLTAAVDARVDGIAPMVFDMLNISAQTEWARQVYGQQSEKIHDYTDLGLVRKEQDETPRMTELRRWIDPCHYRERYTMPKLLLLGTNDPYWTVDSLRHYWHELPEPKLIFQTPNAGHDLGGGKEAEQSLAAFFQMIADGTPLPTLHWQFQETEPGTTTIAVSVDRSVQSFRLWTADSQDRDFRNAQWTRRELPIQPGSANAFAELPAPAAGYRADLVEALLTSPTGHPYRLSTEARVVPDDLR